MYDNFQSEEFITDLLKQSYGKSNVKSVIPFNGTFNKIAQTIKVNKNVFYGQLRINHKYFLQKMLGTSDPTDYPFMLDFVAKLFGSYTEFLATRQTPIGLNWYEGFPILEFNNILFDDLVLLNTNSYFGQTIYPDLNVNPSATVPRSISTLCGNSNSGASVTYPSMLTFSFNPQFLAFTGYLIDVGN